jgi:pentafunctional AROM polypeptide
VTIPLKLDVMPLIDTIDSAAQAIGAVNTIVPIQDAAGKTILTGHNTDWQGMVLALRNAGAHGNTGILTKAGMVIGGGGTARAAIFALKNMGYNPIYLVGRNKAKLGALTHSFSRDYNIVLLSSVEETSQIPADKQPVVAIGTIPGDAPIDTTMREILCSIFQVGATAASTAGVTAGNARKVLLEMAYKPANTALMELARKRGWRTVPGLEALVGQGIHQFKLWTDIMPLYAVCRDAVMGNPVAQ